MVLLALIIMMIQQCRREGVWVGILEVMVA